MPTKRNPQAMRGNRLVINLTLDPDQVAAVDEVADNRRTSRAAIVREAVDFFLASDIADTNIVLANHRKQKSHDAAA